MIVGGEVYEECGVLFNILIWCGTEEGYGS